MNVVVRITCLGYLERWQGYMILRDTMVPLDTSQSHDLASVDER